MDLRLLLTTTLLATGIAMPSLAQSPPPGAPMEQAAPGGDNLGPDDPAGMLDDGDATEDDGADAAAAPPAAADPATAAAPTQAMSPQSGKPRKDRAAKAGNKLEKQFKRADKNNDGYVDAAEMDAFRMRRFDRVDTNGNGQLDPEELDASRAMLHERTAEKAKAKGTTPSAKSMSRDPYRRVDKDGNGIVTRDEYLAGPRAAMKRGDADKDGRISESELSVALSRRASK